MADDKSAFWLTLHKIAKSPDEPPPPSQQQYHQQTIVNSNVRNTITPIRDVVAIDECNNLINVSIICKYQLFYPNQYYSFFPN